MMDRDGPENQSKLEANTGSRSEAREYAIASESRLVCFDFNSDWTTSGAKLLSQSLSVVIQS